MPNTKYVKYRYELGDDEEEIAAAVRVAFSSDLYCWCE